MPRTAKTDTNTRGATSRVRKENVIQNILILPPPHSKTQENLIHAWDLRYDPKDPKFNPADPISTSFYDPHHPDWSNFPLTFPKLRIVVGACGTKFGKTYGCTIRLVKEAWDNPKTLNWWVAPTYAQADNALEHVVALLPTERVQVNRTKRTIKILNPDGSIRSTIEFKSGDDPKTLRGFGVHFFVMDEAAQGMPEASFTSVQTTTTMTQGRGIIISTPNGRGWFHAVYLRGVKYYDDGVTPRFSADDPDPWPEFFSVRMPTHANPYVKLAEVDLKRRQMPADIFEQEYLAKFLNDSAGVFRGIAECEKGNLQEPQANEQYICAADLAKHRDYTVITVMHRRTRHVVYHERFNKISWELQKSRICAVASKYNRALIVLDSTGVGDAIYDDIVSAGYRAEGYTINGPKAKKELITRLQVMLENKEISFPKGSKECPSLFALRKELENYEYKQSESSNVTHYSAPKGQNDDCVISLALCCQYADRAPFVYKHKKIRGI